MDKTVISADYQHMMDDENREFHNVENWKLRTPMCPTCGDEMKKTGRVLEVGLFDDKAYNICQKKKCKKEDHLQNQQVPESACISEDCKDNRVYVPDLLHSEVDLRCKCDMGDDVKWGQFQYHMTTAHGVTKGEFVQLMLDNKRPRARKIAAGQEHVWLEKKRPSKKALETA